MYKHEWLIPTVLIVILFGSMSVVSMGIESNKYRPSTKEFKLRNY